MKRIAATLAGVALLGIVTATPAHAADNDRGQVSKGSKSYLKTFNSKGTIKLVRPGDKIPKAAVRYQAPKGFKACHFVWYRPSVGFTYCSTKMEKLPRTDYTYEIRKIKK